MASEKNPVQDYLTEKSAGFMGGVGEGIRGALTGHDPATQYLLNGRSPIDAHSALRGAGQLLGRSGTSAAVGAVGVGAGALAAMGVQKLYDAATKTRDFRAMLEYSPEITALHAEKPQVVNQMFSTLRMFNPDFTRDPVVASNYVSRMVDNPEGAGGLATEALQSRDKMKHPYADSVQRSLMGSSSKKK